MARGLVYVALAVLGTTAVSIGAAASNADRSAEQVRRGRYLVQIAGCNDCHTAGYAQGGGKVPEKDWLTGDSLGWSGPWGTTYGINLRLFVKDMTASQWLAVTRTTVARPPMPSPALHAMTDDDLLGIYQFIRSLGPAGKPAPAFLPPGNPPTTPVVRFPN
ncbi:MAG: cytochrome C [Steroidobacteraceae bacterium]